MIKNGFPSMRGLFEHKHMFSDFGIDEAVRARWRYLIASVQMEWYPEEYAALEADKSFASNSRIRTYSPFL